MINSLYELPSASISAWVYVILRNCEITNAQISRKSLVHLKKNLNDDLANCLFMIICRLTEKILKSQTF
jgi:hypothetical protein